VLQNIARVIKSRRLRWAVQIARLEEGTFKILTSTSTGKRSLGRPRRRWKDVNVRIDLKEMCINTRNWVDLAQYRVYWRVLVN
jgi:hypothetical protein